MSDNVVDFAAHKLANSPHIKGEARCLVCKHEWQAVAPAGTYQLECPECKLHKGVFVALACSADDQAIWKCNCGGIYYEARPHGLLCIVCGLNHSYSDVKFE